MRLQRSKSKNSISYYITEGFRNEKGLSTSRIVEKLGTAAQIIKEHGPDVDPEQWCLQRLAELEAAKKACKPIPVSVELMAGTPYEAGVQRLFNTGYLWLQKQLYSLSFVKMIRDIQGRYKFEYDLEKVLADLIYSRVLEPSSKFSIFEFCQQTLLEKPDYELHDVYRALDVISKESDFIQSWLYNHNDKIDVKGSNVMFYDCTNFYFEVTEEDDLRKYGHSKENRLNPIVQLGMFMDGNGIPLAFDTTPGNKNEQKTLQPLEKKILSDFSLKGKHLYVCTDAGLASFDNKFFNCTTQEGKDSDVEVDYITIHPIKKMSEQEQEWALDKGRSLKSNPIRPDENVELAMNDIGRNGWHLDGTKAVFSLDDIDESLPQYSNRIFYKEKIVKRYDAKSKKEFDDRIIVTYSLKYKRFMQHKREKLINRALKLINEKNNKKIRLNAKSDVRKLISVSSYTEDGKEATVAKYSLNMDAVAEDVRYDGFYAVSTSVPKEQLSVAQIIDINRGRWEIEGSFMLMKSEFKSRPAFVRLEEHIRAHFTTCFMALLVFRLLEKEVNKDREDVITAPALIDTLRKMNITKLTSRRALYTGSFTRTEITDVLHRILPVRFDCELIPARDMKEALKASKK